MSPPCWATHPSCSRSRPRASTAPCACRGTGVGPSAAWCWSPPRSASRSRVGSCRRGDADAVLDVEGTETTVRYADVARAVVQVEFTRIEEVELDEPDPEGDDDTTDPEEG